VKFGFIFQSLGNISNISTSPPVLLDLLSSHTNRSVTIA